MTVKELFDFVVDPSINDTNIDVRAVSLPFKQRFFVLNLLVCFRNTWTEWLRRLLKEMRWDYLLLKTW